MAFLDLGALRLPGVPGVDAGELEVRQYVVGPISTNCYAVVSEGRALVVDPGAEGARLAEALNDVTVELVVATHGHADHVAGVAALVEATGASFAMAAPDVELAQHARRNHAFGITFDADAPAPDEILAEGSVVRVGAASFRVMDTPGHTAGGIVLVGMGAEEAPEAHAAAGIAFMGDTLFAGSAGRTDLDSGNAAVLARTLQRLKREIAPETRLFCGHNAHTTMSVELAYNPFLA